MKEVLLVALLAAAWTLVNAAANHSTCTDRTAFRRLAKGESLKVRTPLDCPLQVGPGSHSYLRHLTVDAIDGSMLLVSFSNASDAPIVKPNVGFFKYQKPIGKNNIIRSDVTVFVTCNNYWAACSVSVRAVFGCFVPCCYTASLERQPSKNRKASKYNIKCSDGSTRRPLATEDTVGYADEESVKFVQVPACHYGLDPSTMPAPQHSAPVSGLTRDDQSNHVILQEPSDLLRTTYEVRIEQRDKLVFQPLETSPLVGERRLYGVDTGD